MLKGQQLSVELSIKSFITSGPDLTIDGILTTMSMINSYSVELSMTSRPGLAMLDQSSL